MTEVTLQDVYTLQIRRQSNNSNPSPYCEACRNGFVHVNSIQVRQFTQTGKLPGVCRSCNNVFLRICRLQIRHLTHSDSRSHVCPKCNKSFTHAGNIKKHLLLHERQEMHRQEGDDGEASTLAAPLISKPKPPFECKDCGRIFIKYGSFLKHCDKHIEYNAGGEEDTKLNVEESHPTSVNGESTPSNFDKPSYVCEQCGKSFSKPSLLVRHYQEDHEAGFPCQVCRKSFKSKPLLSSHMRCHKHICKLCKKSFTMPEKLELHLQNHVQEQVAADSSKANHVCSFCQKGFVYLGALKKHLMQHTGKAPDVTAAGNKYAPKPPLKTGKKHRIYQCKLCNKYYKFRRTLNKHIAESHSDS